MGSNYILAILVPHVPNLNAGKLAAQCAHAANHFMATLETKTDFKTDIYINYNDWKSSTNQSFGTTHVYDVIDSQFYKFFYEIKNQYPHGIITDPTYPDWDVTFPPPKEEMENFLIEMVTCGWAFIPREELNKYRFKFYV